MLRIPVIPIPVIIVALFAAGPSTASAADEWGDLTLRFVYDGQPPKPQVILVDKDRAVCKQGDIRNESVLVGEEDHGVANVVMWLERMEHDAAMPIHPDYEKTAKAEVTLTVKNCRYEPRVTLVRSSQTLVLKVLDPIAYSFCAELPRGTLDVILPAGGVHKEAFTKSDRVPSRVGCRIHAWLQGLLFVHDNPYAATSDASGRISFTNLPVGKWQFRLWHERCGFIRKATLGGKPVEWKFGRLDVEIKPGANNLGDVLIKPTSFTE